MKPLSPASVGRLVLILFVFSGFAGLIYQSVWSQYLGLTLGHAAYAQTLVLSIFMGGMALGAWGISRYTPSWKKLIRGYGAVELLIGVVGLAFQGIFQFYTQISQESVLPFLNDETFAHLYQWTTAAFLILPQSLLLGATFPLLSAGYLRISPHQDGEVLGGLYFTNSLGAAFGALAATFVLLPAFGLPGTVMTAGGLNVAVGLGAWLVSAWMREGGCQESGAARPAPATASPPVVRNPEEIAKLGGIIFAATGISGATSFVYEIGWVRMLNQALGSSIHSFELMLTAFILGLAFGGLWVRRRGRTIADPVRYVGYVQVLMGMAALFSVPVFAQSFHWVGWLMEGLARTGNGYTLFELGTATIALAVMFPAAFFAGMTLPLFTMALLRAGADERAIGRVYAANTLGSILGVVFMVHVLIPVMGVKMGITLAATIDALLGLYLLRVLCLPRMTAGFATALGGLIAAFSISLHLGSVDPVIQASGVFRTGKLQSSQDYSVPFLRDGKTTTVAVTSQLKSGGSFAITTNGKPDASVTPFDRPPSMDEPTMIIAGVMPLIMHSAPEDIALIGWGSGLSTHTVLGSPVPRKVDTIEIEKAVHDGARFFGERVARAYKDPRSHLHIDDARTFFSTGVRQYDAIISEPSNPWVSGVANLFTVEFYRFLKRHLKEDGVLVQWLYTYEISDPLVATMLSALVSEFPDAEIYLVSNVDLLILAPRNKLPEHMSDAPWREAALAKELARIGVGHPDEIALRRIGSAEIIRQYVHLFGAEIHSDYYPSVSLEAPRTRFIKQRASLLPALVTNGLPVLDILDCRVPPGSKFQIGRPVWSPFGVQRLQAIETVDVLRSSGDEEPSEALANLLATVQAVPTPARIGIWSHAIATLAGGTLGALPEEDLQDIWKAAPTWLPAGIEKHALATAVLRAYSASARRDPGAMLEAAEAALAMPEAMRLAPKAREHLLVIAMLGAIGSGNPAKVQELDGAHTENMPNDFELIRAYLLAWADSGVPACIARK